MNSRSTNVIVAAASRTLARVALLRELLEKTQACTDTLFAWLLLSASAQVEAYCHRIFARETLLDTFRIDRNDTINRIALSRYPVSAVYAVVVRDPWNSSEWAPLLESAMDASQTTLPCSAALEVPAEGYPFNVLVGIGDGAEVVRVTGINAGTTYDVVRGVSNTATAHADGAVVNVALHPSRYEYDPQNGLIWRLDRGGDRAGWNERVLVCFQGGYRLPNDELRDLPWDIEDATMKMMNYAWRSRGRDPAIRSISEPGIGQISYWIGTPPDVIAILDGYRDYRL